MALIFTAGCWIKFCTYLGKVICLYNYYNQFHHPSYKQVQRSTLSIPRVINSSSSHTKFQYLTANCPTFCFNQFCWNLINTWQLVSFLAFQQSSQPPRHSAQALMALLSVFQPVEKDIFL